MANVLVDFNALSSSIKSAGIAGAMIKTYHSGTIDDAYYHLGNPKGAKVNLTMDTDTDDRNRPMAAGDLVEVVYPSMESDAYKIATLGTIAGNQEALLRLQFTDGNYIDTSQVTANTTMGIRWKLICDQKFRMIEWTLRSMYLRSEMDSLLIASPVAVGTPAGTDALYTSPNLWSQSAVYASQLMGGITKIELSSDGSNWEDVGNFNGAQYTIECVGGDGAGARMKPYNVAIKFDISANLNSTTLAQMELRDAIAQNQLGIRLTHSEGSILTLTTANIGVVADLVAEGGYEATRQMKLKATGILTDFTAWAALWS